MDKYIGVLGIATIFGVAYLMSDDRKSISWRAVISGTLLTFVIALAVRLPWFTYAFETMGWGIDKILESSKKGAEAVLGNDLVYGKWIFAVQVYFAIVFVNILTTIGFHLKLIQPVVKAFAWCMQRTMGISGAEAFSSSASVFLGQVESQLVVRPYLSRLTNSELFAMMTTNMSTIAGTVLVVYVSMGMNAALLIAASIMTAPAGLTLAKIICPEKDKEAINRQVKMEVEDPYLSVFDAFLQGATEGAKLGGVVIIMVFGAVAMVAFLNTIFGGITGMLGYNLQLQDVLAYPFAPAMWLIGVPWVDCLEVGREMATRILVNEFVAYLDLAKQISAGSLTPKGQMVATIALCGFCNFSSIAINVGGLAMLIPERRTDLLKMGMRALIAANLATWLGAALVGILY